MGGAGGMCLSHPSITLIHQHTSGAVGVPLPPLPVRIVSGAALDDPEHSLTDLDFCDQFARRLCKSMVKSSPMVVTTPHIQFPNRCRDGPL